MQQNRAVKNRCAVDLDELNLPIPQPQILDILSAHRFKIIDIDLISLARQCISTSCYRRSARSSEAPSVVDCSSFIKWLYGERGIWLPRRSIQQRQLGEFVSPQEIIAGDIVFVSGLIDYFFTDPTDGVGHVGIATGEDTVIHAANKKCGVIETPLAEFLNRGARGIKRYIPKNRKVLTIETPPEREVETSNDIRWIVLQTLPH